ncbi:MAG: hypothetical protein AABY33_02600 [Pseudomonadota bacterium]|mgnify:CR=1 FL=1
MAMKLELRQEKTKRDRSKPEPEQQKEPEQIRRGGGPEIYTVTSDHPDFKKQFDQLLKSVTAHDRGSDHPPLDKKSQRSQEIVEQLEEMKKSRSGLKWSVGAYDAVGGNIEIVTNIQGKDGKALKFTTYGNGGVEISMQKPIIKDIEQGRTFSKEFYEKNPSARIKIVEYSLKIEQATGYARGLLEIPRSGPLVEDITGSNKKIHEKLLGELDRQISDKDNFKTRNGTTTIKTLVLVGGGDRLTVVMGKEGDVRFQTDSGKEIGRTSSPKQAEVTFKSLIDNQFLLDGINNTKDTSGKPVNYEVKAHNGVVTTSVDIGGKPIHITQQDGKITVPGYGENLDTNKALQHVKEKVESSKPKVIEQPQKPATVEDLKALTAEHVSKSAELEKTIKVLGEKLTASEIRELGDKIPKIKLGIGAGIGILAPQLAEAAIDKAPKELPKGADRMVGIMGPIGYAANEAAKAISGSKEPSKKEVGSVLSEADKRMAAEIAKQFDNFGIPAPTSDVVANQHISSKSQQTSRATPGS